LAVDITIQGTIISFPESGGSPDWAPAVVEFAQAVEAALQSVAGTYDVPQQSFSLDSFNPGTAVDIPNLAFPITNVRAAFIKYSVYRTTTLEAVAESGDMIIVYNSNTGIWALAQERVGDSSISFSIANNGQLSFSTTVLSGTSHTGTLVYEARAMEE